MTRYKKQQRERKNTNKTATSIRYNSQRKRFCWKGDYESSAKTGTTEYFRSLFRISKIKSIWASSDRLHLPSILQSTKCMIPRGDVLVRINFSSTLRELLSSPTLYSLKERCVASAVRISHISSRPMFKPNPKSTQKSHLQPGQHFPVRWRLLILVLREGDN